jgi:cytoskeletal protein RodZ
MPAARRGEESKQGLIITLVVFVVLTVLLGVFTYLGYSGQDQIAQSEKKAKEETNTMKKDRDWYKYQALLWRNYTGDLKEKSEDYRDLEQLKASASSLGGSDRTAVEQAINANNALLVKVKGGEFEHYKDRVQRLASELANTQDQLAKAQALLTKANADYAAKKKNADDEIAALQDQHKQALEANRKDFAARAKDLEDKLNEFNQLSVKLAELTKKMSETTETGDKEKGGLKKQIDNLNIQITKLREKLTPPDLFKYDNPKGRIVRLDPRGEVAWVSIGSADNVRGHQNLTFSIFSSESGSQSNAERKGALEIVDVLEPHMSMAKITEVTDPNRNPIVTGDVLINPAWSPTNQIHVGVAGLIDLTGEGRDNTDEFLRNLRREGIVVDAYLDLHDVAIKGDGMTIKTDYLIRGEMPSFDLNGPLKLEDQRVQRKEEILSKIAAMEKQASELGATVVPFRRFVLLTGYKLPRGVGVQPGAGYDFLRPSETLSPVEKPAAKKAEKPAAKKEKKEDDEDKEKDKDKDNN